MVRAQTSTTNTTMGTAMATGRLTFDPDFAGASSDLDDEGRIDCEKIFVGSIGNAVWVGVRKWQLYRRTSMTVARSVIIRTTMLGWTLTVPQIHLVRRQVVAKAALVHDNIREVY